MDLCKIMNSIYVEEEVKISDYPLTDYNDIATRSNSNIHRPKVWVQVLSLKNIYFTSLHI